MHTHVAIQYTYGAYYTKINDEGYRGSWSPKFLLSFNKICIIFEYHIFTENAPLDVGDLETDLRLYIHIQAVPIPTNIA